MSDIYIYWLFKKKNPTLPLSKNVSFIRKHNLYKSVWVSKYTFICDLKDDFDLDYKGHPKVKFNFRNGNPYLRSQIRKEREILLSNMVSR